MNYSNLQIVFQEVPDEISLCFSISGCKIGCKGCHSTETWNENYGQELTQVVFLDLIKKYEKMISCILFYGGEWNANKLINILKIAKSKNLKTCLYSGLNTGDLIENYSDILKHLDFLKTGPWKSNLGGLNSITTNQRFYELKKEQLLDVTYKFQK